MQALSFSHHGTCNVQCGCTLYNTGSKAKLFLSCFVWFIYLTLGIFRLDALSNKYCLMDYAINELATIVLTSIGKC